MIVFITAAPIATAGADKRAPAASKPRPGTDHSPPRFVDEATTELALTRVADGKTDGYGINFFARIGGATGAADRVRLDWKQGRKLIASLPCSLDVGDAGIGVVRCSPGEKPLAAKGAIDAELIYSDDADGSEYLVRTYQVTVAKYPSFGDAVWQLVPDDLLSAAWVRHHYPFKLSDNLDGHPHFFFWVAHQPINAATLRCTVDGTKVPEIELEVGSPTDGRIQLQADTHPKGKDVLYRWTHVAGVASAYFGRRSDYTDTVGHDLSSALFLGDHPGAWVCQVRSDGAAIRELAFTVDQQGLISSALQTAPGAPPTLPNVAAIELRFPAGVAFDDRIRPAAMKKSRGYGLPWPDAPAVKAIKGSFPAARGLPDPK